MTNGPINTRVSLIFFFNDTATTEIYPLSLHAALPLYLQPEERALAAAINAVKEAAAKAVAQEDYEGAMAAIARLRADVDAFFEKVTVNVEMADRRENRLKLLNEIREATRAVADFSKIEG